MPTRTPKPIPFAGSPLDRAGNQRRGARWVQEHLAAPESRFLPLYKLDPLARAGAEGGLAWATSDVVEYADARTGPIFLGLRDGVAHFALDLSPTDEPVETLGLDGVASFRDARALASSLPDGEAAIVAQARGLIGWHERHRFCSACGKPTEVREAGYMRECEECDAQHFPRTDPVVIMLATRGERCLLGRQSMFPKNMYSALAGFMEPGETIEEAVRREVAEEAGIRVGEVRYHASQPWPFPASLMIGCLADALDDEIRIDTVELAEARWFERDKIRKALDVASEDLFVPPPMAIAHHLIRAWANDD